MKPPEGRACCSLDLLEAASGYFALTLAQARAIIAQVATVASTWRATDGSVGALPAEITRMSSTTNSHGRWSYDTDRSGDLVEGLERAFDRS